MKKLIISLILISLILSPLFSNAQTITTNKITNTYNLKISNYPITLELSQKDNSNKIE
ncbi:MAG: hypothetical protein KatS3mg094_585 [Candidatus Parcubacteria bacterium]|nr:MAG: hypothetical protein KatS3mg094_155 [Candidatus Parcubacteria bacterium]GIW65934.1 MAG: hypothetical protein KatS3mg094_453 [Candidatus Parcubacteria bacterium]GIW66066.1 MAG: hypothetical protein KatS3mg094_585 [Candidatus Parcubacteria bacterium]